MKQYRIEAKQQDGSYKYVGQGTISDAVRVAWDSRAAVRVRRVSQ